MDIKYNIVHKYKTETGKTKQEKINIICKKMLNIIQKNENNILLEP